jgi:biopolymer transport protein ExbD
VCAHRVADAIRASTITREVYMGFSVEGGGRGRRKDVNAELNLVPYIDLLTCMVAFLLITAVWTQLARLEVQQKGQGESSGAEPPPTKIAVLVHKDGFALVVGQNQQQDQQPIPQARGDYDYATLAKELKRLKESHQDKTDLQVLSEDAIKFEILVKTMDAAMAAGFPDISLLDAGSAAL